jgi:hypothetical protein
VVIIFLGEGVPSAGIQTECGIAFLLGWDSVSQGMIRGKELPFSDSNGLHLNIEKESLRIEKILYF